MKHAGPLVGRNVNVTHGGRTYHVQTEDSGARRPNVTTHLFADGGRIVHSVKTSYAEHVASPDLADRVRALMSEQHGAMLAALSAGEFDQLILDPAARPAIERRGFGEQFHGGPRLDQLARKALTRLRRRGR
ncbi:MAG: hypothetical protein EXR75_04995 [Myxococcales bacterium]|nr:hypothetical protein [Myxococcales bacterium]